MNDPQAAHAAGKAIERLIDQQVRLQMELERRETSGGTYHDVQKMNRLRDDIQKLDRRIARAERLQNGLI